MFDEEPYVFLASLGKYTPIKKIHCSQKTYCKEYKESNNAQITIKSVYLKAKFMNSGNSYEKKTFKKNQETILLAQTKINWRNKKKFKTIRSYFSDRVINSYRLFLKKKGELPENDQTIAKS